MRSTAGFLTLLLVLSGCADRDGLVTLDAGAHGTAVEVPVGATVVLELESNPSTGHSWIVPDDLAGLTLVDETWFGDADATGSPGTSRLEFRVDRAGTWSLDLEYRRPWETGAAPDRTFSVTISTG